MDEIYYKHIGSVIRDARKKHGMTQQEVADRLGITRSLYSQYERGACSITLKTWIELARLLGLTMEDAVGTVKHERSNFS